MKIRAPHRHTYITNSSAEHCQAAKASSTHRHTNICSQFKWTFVECVGNTLALCRFLLLLLLYFACSIHQIRLSCRCMFFCSPLLLRFRLCLPFSCCPQAHTHTVHCLCRYLSLHSFRERGSRSVWTRRASNIHFIRVLCAIAMGISAIEQTVFGALTNSHALHSTLFERRNEYYYTKDNNDSYNNNGNNNDDHNNEYKK